MNSKTEEQIRGLLMGLITDGFNRSINALEEAGAIETKRMRREYKGIGSKYYDLVTDQINFSLDYSMRGIVERIVELTHKPGDEIERETQ